MGNITTHQYRPDIDGLRAVAVMAVIIYHAVPSILPGGYLGVDIFFVISGYLITSILIRQSDSNTFSIGTFFERRIRRIAPALFAMISAVLVAGFFLLLPSDFEKLASSSRYVVGSLSNVFFNRLPNGYFNHANTDLLPLLHTWSLAIEEQFYIILPAIFLLASRRQALKKFLPYIVTLIGFASFILYIWQMKLRPQAVFYLIPYRAWEFTVGSSLAFWAGSDFSRPPSVVWNQALGLAALALTSLPLFKVLEQPYAGVCTCIGSVALIASGIHREGIAQKLLSWKPLVFVGLISYSAYLWHWPMLAFQAYIPVSESHSSSQAIRLTLCFLCMPVAFLSHKYIETPFRRSAASRKEVFAGYLLASTALFMIALLVKTKHGFCRTLPAEVIQLVNYEKSRNRVGVDEFMDMQKPAEKFFVYGDNSRPSHIALWGDSHAQALGGILHVMGMENQQAINFYGKPATPPVVGLDHLGKEKTEYAQQVLALLESNPNIRDVVVSCFWPAYVPTERSRNPSETPTAGDAEKAFQSKLEKTITCLRKAGKRVFLIYPTPEASSPVPRYLALQSFYGRGRASMKGPDKANFYTRNKAVLSAFDSLESGPDLVRIKLYEKMLSDHEILLQTPKGDAFYFDTHHITQEAAAYLRPCLEVIFK